jgi:hypothetical protein
MELLSKYLQKHIKRQLYLFVLYYRCILVKFSNILCHGYLINGPRAVAKARKKEPTNFTILLTFYKFTIVTKYSYSFV